MTRQMVVRFMATPDRSAAGGSGDARNGQIDVVSAHHHER